jgi:hypothetical protein
MIPGYNPLNIPIKDMATLAREGDFAVLSQFYAFSDEDSEAQIIQFIKDHLFLLNILIEAPRYILSIFGSDVTLEIELDHDPEEDFEGLFIIIRTSLSPEDSLDLLDRLDEEWWLDVDDNISNILEIMVRPT